MKVSLHEPGPSIFALTKEWVQQKGFQAPEGKDRRLAVQWERPRPRPPRQIARPLTIVVPWDEVLDRRNIETGRIIWVPPPPVNMCIHFDVVYIPAEAQVTGHPGARSMGTGLVGEVQLQNGERVFVTWLARHMEDSLRQHVMKLRSARIVDRQGNLLEKAGMLAFGTEPNPDANDGTQVGILLDVTRNQ